MGPTGGIQALIERLHDALSEKVRCPLCRELIGRDEAEDHYAHAHGDAA